MLDADIQYERLIDFFKKTVDMNNVYEEYAINEDDYNLARSAMQDKADGYNIMRKFPDGIAIGALIGGAVIDPRLLLLSVSALPVSMALYLASKYYDVKDTDLVRLYAYTLQTISEVENNIKYPFKASDEKDIRKIKAFVDEFESLDVNAQSEYIKQLCSHRELGDD